jgi:hypothetical protein
MLPCRPQAPCHLAAAADAELLKILARWYSTVLALMNSRAALSPLEGARRRAGDLLLLRGEHLWSPGAARAGPLASGMQLGLRAGGEGFHAYRLEHLQGCT